MAPKKITMDRGSVREISEDLDNDDKHVKAQRQKEKEAPPIDVKTFLSFVLIGTISCGLRAFATEETFPLYRNAKLLSRLLLAVFMLGGAALRLDAKTVEGLLVIVPPPLPPKLCVYASGLVEGIAGVLLLVTLPGDASTTEMLHDAGGCLVVALLWAVFPANAYHAFSKTAQQKTNLVGQEYVLYARIVIQFIFLGWAGWHAGTTLPEGYPL